jgi:ArsR family transcriptional regulator
MRTHTRPETDEILARRLKVLGHPDRLRLLRLLTQPERFPGNLVDPVRVGICVNDLAKAAGLPQSTTSHHLGLLQEAGLLVSTEHGSWRYIRPDGAAFAELGAAVKGLAP